MSDISRANQPTQSTQPNAKRKGGGPVAAIVVAVLAVFGIATMSDDEPAPDSSDSRPAIAAVPEAGPEEDADTDLAEPELALPDDDAAVGADTATVPDVVGLNHQLAQDTLQANGFYLLHEEDATGQGRMLILDRNWEVVSQSVPAGTSASTGTAITLYSKKIGE